MKAPDISESRAALRSSAAAGTLRLPEGFRQIREALGLTQAEFARLFRLTRRQVYELEAGRANPTLETITRIARPFGFVPGFVLKPTEPDRSTTASQRIATG